MEDNNIDEGSPLCRVCFSKQLNIEINPLISPCRCIGSMQFIHLLCLYEWILNKSIITKSEHCIIYSWQSLECELCKTKLDTEYIVQGKKIHLYE